MQAMKCGLKSNVALERRCTALAKLSSSYLSSLPAGCSNDFTDKVAGKVESCKHDVSQ